MNWYLYKVLKKSYASSCNISYECNNALGLICPSSPNTCNCPINMSTLFCDCPRKANNEFYWNGTSCQQASSYGQACQNASTNYMCQTITQGTICNGTALNFTCQCPYLSSFDILINACKAQVSFNQSCVIDACIVSNGLFCIGGICE